MMNDFLNAETAYNMSVSSKKYKKLLTKIEELIRDACMKGYFRTTFTRDTELSFEIRSIICSFGYEIKEYKSISSTSDKNNISVAKFDYVISWNKPNKNTQIYKFNENNTIHF